MPLKFETNRFYGFFLVINSYNELKEMHRCDIIWCTLKGYYYGKSNDNKLW